MSQIATLVLTVTRAGGANTLVIHRGPQGRDGSQAHYGATPPADTSLIWFHTGLGIWFVYDTDSWIAQSPDSGIPDGALTFGGDVLTFGGDTLTFTAA